MNRILFFALLAACNDRSLGPVGSAGESLCRFEGGSRAVLATLEDHQIQLVHADRSATTAFVFDHPEARNFFGQALVARGDLVAASASWVVGDTLPWNADVVVLDTAGHVRWQGTRGTNGSYVQLFLNARGHLAVALGTDGLLVDADGRSRELHGWMPIAEPADDGSVVLRSAGDMPMVAWLRAGATDPEPLGAPPNDPYFTPVMVSGRLAYVSPGEGGAQLVSELPGDVRKVSLPGIDAATVNLTDHTDGGWVLVGEWRTPRYLVHVHTLEARPVGISDPTGFRAFQGALYGPRLDSDGALLMGLRDDWAGALYRSANGRDWQRIGGTVTNVLDIDPMARGGTYVVNATSGRYSFEEWTPPTPDHQPDYTGDLVQVVRPAAGVAQKLPTSAMWVELASLQLSNDGRCLAFVDNQTLTAWDVEHDRTYSLVPSTNAQAFAWME
jgi:hypothetical protein